jgi:hypothetical protein
MNYSKLLIYKIVCNDLNIKEVYVGSTVNFTRRKCQHKSRCYNINDSVYNEKKYQFIRDNGGWENWTMLEIEKYPCNDKNEAHTRERYWIEILNATLNKYIPTRTTKQYQEDNKDKILEYKKKYDDDNKDKLKDYIRNYYKNNNDKIIDKAKEYYTDNKEAISERKKKTFLCDCGKTILICVKQQHYRSQKHIKYIESTK